MSRRRRSQSAVLTGFYAGLFALVLNTTFLGAFYGWHLPPRLAGADAQSPVLRASTGSAVEILRPALDVASVSKKIDLPVTVVEQQLPEPIALSDQDQDVGVAHAESPPVVPTAMPVEDDPPVDVDMANTVDSLPEGIPTMLRETSKGVEIGHFKSVTMQGGADECLAIGQSLANSVKGSQLDVMVTSRQITIAKICASNGAVFLTCRAGQISISPRRSRPDSRCDKDDA